MRTKIGNICIAFYHNAWQLGCAPKALAGCISLNLRNSTLKQIILAGPSSFLIKSTFHLYLRHSTFGMTDLRIFGFVDH